MDRWQGYWKDTRSRLDLLRRNSTLFVWMYGFLYGF
jgi:hypothetical protein